MQDPSASASAGSLFAVICCNNKQPLATGWLLATGTGPLFLVYWCLVQSRSVLRAAQGLSSAESTNQGAAPRRGPGH
jgi:hypothetical protein